MSENPKQNHESKSPGYESRDVNIGRVVAIGLACVVILVVIMIFLDQYFTISREKVIQDVVLKPQSVTLRELRAHEDEILNSYKVLDSQKGVYQIPISRAMEIQAQKAYAP
jgi:hypothetical protein